MKIDANLAMPAATQRAHFKPSWRGDGLDGLLDTANMPVGRDGIKAIDCNFQWAWNDPKNYRIDKLNQGSAFCMHWTTPYQNNYKFIVHESGIGVRAMTQFELHKHIITWRADDVRRWRRRATIVSEAPMTYHQMCTNAVQLGVVICAELKSTAFAWDGPAQQLVHAAHTAGHPPFFMALYKSMADCKEKCGAIIRAGGQFAVIFGRFQKYRLDYQAEVKSWTHKPTRVW